MVIPRLVVAAPASGAGKTTVSTGLVAALTRAGRSVAPFKVGPDYSDPGYHALAAGRPGRNLDPVLVGEHRIRPLFAHGAAGCDIAVIEGVMGLFDGRVGTPGFGSTAHVAALLDAPVVLTVDSRGQGRSLAALLHGFRGYQSDVRIGGVVLNRVGSDRHEAVLREACAEVGLPVLGALRRSDAVALPSRHLGLVPAVEHGSPAVGAIDSMADIVIRSVDLAAVLALAHEAGPLLDSPWNPAVEMREASAMQGTSTMRDAIEMETSAAMRVDSHGRLHSKMRGVSRARESLETRVFSHKEPVVAVAGGPAFTFGYAEHAELLAAAGAEVVVVDPLRDEKLPPDTAALVLPGGFPEEHAAELSANLSLRAAVADFARSGGIVHAECGGLLYLARKLDGRPMCGVLDASAVMSGSLTLGYRDAVAATDSVLHPGGSRISGHEFHRTRVTPGSGGQAAWHWRNASGKPVTEGFVTGRVHASYLHTHPAGSPDQVKRLVSAGGRL
jgi:cobyrinic acid a,c-diamide synthase